MKTLVMILVIVGVVAANEILGALIGFKLGYVLIAMLAMACGRAVTKNMGKPKGEKKQDAGPRPEPKKEPVTPPNPQPRNQYCPNCGSLIAPGAKFCNTCGQKLSGTQGAPQKKKQSGKGIPKGVWIALAAVLVLGVAAFAISSAFVDTSDWNEYSMNGLDFKLPEDCEPEDFQLGQSSVHISWDGGSAMLDIFEAGLNDLQFQLDIDHSVFDESTSSTPTYSKISRKMNYSYYTLTLDSTTSDFTSRFYTGLVECGGKNWFVEYNVYGRHDDETFFGIMDSIEENAVYNAEIPRATENNKVLVGYTEYTNGSLTMSVPIAAMDYTGDEGMEGFTFVLASTDMAIVGLKEAFADFNNGQPMTEEEYANLFMEVNGFTSTVQQSSGYHYFLFSNNGNEYLAAFFADSDGIWSVQIGMEHLDESAAHMIAQTVRIG